MLWLVHMCMHANTYMHAYTHNVIHSLTHMYEDTHVNAHRYNAQCHLPLYLCVEEIQLTLVECIEEHIIEMKYLSTAIKWQRTAS